ncbi:hypothetical protein WR25_25919 [Diploscapter pachys]|uniref:RING-type domain-containing protein n=1 Tax=Diploscapter pachys TaxID=2018661 RepID=A0A2A2KS89_9BILA|nr:hypothetical protein WR25_25919 [Diploscapter pachys]
MIEILSRSIAVTDSWFKLHIVDRVLKIGKCLLCYEYMRPVQLLYCVSPHCKATYCTVCVLENFGKCYACQTEAGLVDSTRSQLIPTNLNEIPQELSTSYGGMFINNRQKAQQHRELITEREHTERKVGMQRKKSVEAIQSALKASNEAVTAIPITSVPSQKPIDNAKKKKKKTKKQKEPRQSLASKQPKMHKKQKNTKITKNSKTPQTKQTPKKK